jgi:perosamine synthetase
MVAAIVAIGAEPLFYAIDARGLPSIDFLDSQDLHEVRALVAVHYFGLPLCFAPLRAFCDARQITFLEDCAHSMFGIADSRAIGTWGDYAIASLTKFFPVSDGGIVARARCAPPPGRLTLSTKLLARQFVTEVRSMANAIEAGAARGGFAGVNTFLRVGNTFHKTILRRDVTPRVDEVPPPGLRESQPAFWLRDFARLKHGVHRATLFSQLICRHAGLSRIVERRRANYLLLAELLKGVTGAYPLCPILPHGAAPYVFPLYVDHPERSYQSVRKAGMPVYRWDELWPGVPQIAGDFGTDWATHVFQLGCHQDLNPAHIRAMAGVLRDILAESSS